jgi:hypothetical protein
MILSEWVQNGRTQLSVFANQPPLSPAAVAGTDGRHPLNCYVLPALTSDPTSNSIDDHKRGLEAEGRSRPGGQQTKWYMPDLSVVCARIELIRGL